MLIQIIINGLISGSVYAIVALGFSLIYRSTKILHLAHAAVFTSAAYFLYMFHVQFHLGLFLSGVLSFLCAGIIGALMEITVYQPLFKDEASSNVMLVSSIGIMTVVVNIIPIIWGNESRIIVSSIWKTYKWNNPFVGSESSFKNILLTEAQLYQLAISILTIILVLLILKYTKFGRRINAICESDRLVLIFGVSLNRYRVLIFFVGSVLAGLGSVLIAMDVGMDPGVGMPILLIAAVAVIVGGTEHFAGAVLGGFLMGFAKAMAVWKMSARWENMIVFLLLIVFLLFRPEGILSRNKRKA